MSSIDVSVIIVNWNTKDLLIECLKSIKEQETDHQIEVIVVDNGSEDGSKEEVSRIFPDVKLILNSTNLGFSKANNLGMRVSNGRYLCLLNSDVRLLSGCLQRLTDHMDSNPSVGMAGPQILFPDLRIQNSCRKFPSLWNNFCSAFRLDRIFPKSSFFSGEHMGYFAHDVLIKPDYLAGCALMVRRNVLCDEVFDERFFIYAEEVDLARQIWTKGWEVLFFPAAKAVHHHAVSSARDPLRFLLARERSVFQYWRKHHRLSEVIALKAIFLTRNISQILIAFLLYLFTPHKRSELSAKISRNVSRTAKMLKH